MKKLLVVVAVVAVGWFGVRQIGCANAPDLTIEGDEVLLATGDLDVRFARGKPLDDTFMVFGGAHIAHRNALANVTLAGLSVRHARPIYRRHPDFHRCASPGAALAKDKVIQLDVVPADGATLASLRSSLEEFDDNLRSGGDRVCVRLHGARLALTSVEVREAGESVTDQVRMDNFYLVDSARRVECREALEGA